MRPEILFPLFAPIASLKGVGPRVAPMLEKVAGRGGRDVLFLAPQNLVRRQLTTAAVAGEGEERTFVVQIEAHQRPGRPGHPWKIRTFDGTGFISLIFFRAHGPRLEQAHPKGAKRIVSGRIERNSFDHELQIVHPDYLWPIERAEDVPEIEAVYPATAGLPSRTIRRFALEALERTPELPEWQDPAWLKQQRWPAWREAFEALHNPASEADLSPQSPARRRLAFDELLAHQLALAQRKASRRAEPARVIPASAQTDRVEADPSRSS